MGKKFIFRYIISVLFIVFVESVHAINKVENAAYLSDLEFKELVESLLPQMIEWRAEELQEFKTQLSSTDYACVALYYANNYSDKLYTRETQISLCCDSILHATMFFIANHKLWQDKATPLIIHQYAERLYENGYNFMSAFWVNIGVISCLINNYGGPIYGELRSLESVLEIDSLPQRSVETQLKILEGSKDAYAHEPDDYRHRQLVKHYLRAAELALRAGYYSEADSIKEEALDFLWDRKNIDVMNGKVSIIRETSPDMFQLKAIESELLLYTGDTIQAIEENEILLWRYYENAAIGRLKQEHFPYYFKAIKFLSGQNRFDESNYEHLIYASEYIRDYMISVCPSLSPIMQANFYLEARQTIELINSQLINFIDKDDVNKTIYNNLLLFKGLELNTAKVLNNKDYSVAYKSDSNNYDDLLFGFVRLQYKTITMQAEILNTSDFKSILEVDYNTISTHLDNNSIAIEFLNDKYSNHYYACICASGWDEPIIVSLLSSEYLNKTYTTKRGYFTNTLFSKIWQPILEHLPNTINKIYFAPDGLLYAMAIEYLPIPYQHDLRNVNDIYELYRVSSTKEVVNSHKDQSRHEKCVLLVGDIDFGNTTTGGKERGVFDDFNENSKISRLVASKVEIDELSSLFKNNGWVVYLLTGRTVSKDALLNPSDQYSIEHISTHGFFINDHLISSQIARKFTFLNDPLNLNNVQDTSLLRSGFVISSANDFYSSGDDVGIITAADIANTNRQNVDLVVISACQSGQGVINGDGIHGLQRGYKIAGANSIIVALWDVDDWVSEFLIKEFYTYYLLGHSKQESLRKAQWSVRSYKGVMPDNQPRNLELPKYWGAFILLDGIR